ncbi:MAG: cell division protein FtsA [Rhodospirillaceae bacterium]|nr:cell division protein FtsA [Rhodospirillaceae bacterium]
MGYAGPKRIRHRPRGDILAAVDVGTTKIVCFVTRVGEGGAPKIVGIGHQASRGLRNGAVIDMEAATGAIGEAVAAAEKMAGEQIDRVLVSMAGGFPASQTLVNEVVVPGHQIGESDVRHALRHQTLSRLAPDSTIVHAVPIGYAVDGNRGAADPTGMFAERLGVDLHVVTAQTGAMRNLATCIHNCHLEIEAFAVAPYAAALASLVEDEMQLGACCVDLGGGTTGVTVFYEGKLVFCDVVPVGGSHITVDVARGLTTPLHAAERMKTLHGNAITSPADDREMIDVPQVGENEPAQTSQVPKSLLTGIIEPRVEEIFELVRGRLEASGFDRIAGRRFVLTGGTSQLQGIRELAARVLDKQVRLSRPAGLPGLAAATGGPAFAAAIGLLAHADRHAEERTLVDDIQDEPASGLLGRIGEWLREYF